MADRREMGLVGTKLAPNPAKTRRVYPSDRRPLPPAPDHAVVTVRSPAGDTVAFAVRSIGGRIAAVCRDRQEAEGFAAEVWSYFHASFIARRAR